MHSTIIVLTLLFGLTVVQVLLWAIFLRIGLRWAGVADVRTRRIVAATGIVVAVEGGLYGLLRLLQPPSTGIAVFLGLLEIVAVVLVPCLVVAQIFKVRFLVAFRGWLPTLIPSIGMIVVVLLVVLPFVCEVFVVSSNAMAPTLLGTHARSTCPACGRSRFCSPVEQPYGFSHSRPRDLADPIGMICENFHVTEAAAVDKKVFPPDRFVVAKFVEPRRWDMVVFRYPEDPSAVFVMRLVGLPGETIHIEDGAVWANGKRLELPTSLNGLEYLSELPELRGWRDELWGSKDRPAVLGDDEYFVLGDWSLKSMDSRLWEDGAPGHSPFAVPKSYLRGVVICRYWPPQRWRVFR